MLVKNQIYAIDHHHGQANRTVLSGYPTIRGATMREKEAFYLENLSWIHECMCREPRGHGAMLGSIVTEPVEEGSAFGVLFLHANGLFDGCGDSTFGTAAAAVETGLVEAMEPVTRLTMDSVMGPLHVEVDVSAGVVQEVRYDNLPAYHIKTLSIDLPGWGRTAVDLSHCGGQWFPRSMPESWVCRSTSRTRPKSRAWDVWSRTPCSRCRKKPIRKRERPFRSVEPTPMSYHSIRCRLPEAHAESPIRPLPTSWVGRRAVRRRGRSSRSCIPGGNTTPGTGSRTRARSAPCSAPPVRRPPFPGARRPWQRPSARNPG